MLILSLLLASSCAAEIDDVLAKARALSKQDEPDKAISLLNEYLQTNPEDSDALVLLGLICSWNHHYDDGRHAFSAVLAADPDYKDAVLGLTNLEIWDGNLGRAEQVIRAGLVWRPQDADYKAAFAKVKAQQSPPKDPAEAAILNGGGKSKDGPSWETGIVESNIWFSDQRSSWHETAVDISHHFTNGWVTATFSHASWFGEGSNLIDIESYPRIRPGTYAFVEAAFSPDATLYARRRFGAEIFQSLPKGFEASLGIRYMRFNSNTFLYTGSAGKYFGNYWILARTFVSPDVTYGWSKSLQVSLRRYFADADHFIGVRVGVGASPFEVRTINDIDLQNSESAMFEGLWRFKNGLGIRVLSGVARQTRLYTGALWQFETDGTLYYRF